MNVFRAAADLIHLFATLNLLWRICKSRSCSGLSGKSQILLALVWTTRYLDLFTQFVSPYNTIMKILFIWTAYAGLFLIFFVYRTSYDQYRDTFRFEFLIGPCLILALVINYHFSILEILWTFSVYLEAVAMLPQLFMLSKAGPPAPMIRDYLIAMAAYRTLYTVNWAYRYFFDTFVDPIAAAAGCLQVTLLWSFLISFYEEHKGENEDKVAAEHQNQPCSGFYIQTVMERLADIIYSSNDDAVHTLMGLQNEIRRRGVAVENDQIKQHGYRNFKMFVEDQPWLVLFSDGAEWFVRRRLGGEARLPRPLVDVNRRPSVEVVKQKIIEEEEAEDGDFIDPYGV